MCLPGIDGVCDYDAPHNWIPDIWDEYVVEYQENGIVYHHVYTVFEGEDAEFVFNQALNFSRSVNAMRFYDELGCHFYHPKTGEEIFTPDEGQGIHAYEEPYQSYKNPFVRIEEDELPF